jgi:hypothetical protein
LGYLNPPCRRRRARSGFGEKMEKKLEDCLGCTKGGSRGVGELEEEEAHTTPTTSLYL